MRHYYFVSYAHSTGFGSVELNLDVPVTHMTQIRSMEEWIKNDAKLNACTILNYQLLRIE